MKNLDYYLRIDSEPDEDDSHLSLTLNHISGGRISKTEINAIQEFPGATSISISGLVQDTFDYFIENYGRQFKAINFWKCPLVKDFRRIESLPEVVYITYYWNQRAEQLWDFSKTKSLKGFSFDDFTRMHDISQIPEAPALEELSFGNMVWPKYILNTLEPLADCTGLKNLTFSAKKILDNRIEPIAHLKNLEKLEFPSNMFATEQVAWLKAHLPPTVQSRVLHPYWQIEGSLEISGKQKDTFIVGKRKPFLDSVRDKKRMERYVQQFNDMYHWYLENPASSPEDYQAA
jgi:hypothetical protein